MKPTNISNTESGSFTYIGALEVLYSNAEYND